MHAGLLFVVVVVAPQGGGTFWTNRAETHGQLVLSPMRLPEQLRIQLRYRISPVVKISGTPRPRFVCVFVFVVSQTRSFCDFLKVNYLQKTKRFV